MVRSATDNPGHVQLHLVGNQPDAPDITPGTRPPLPTRKEPSAVLRCLQPRVGPVNTASVHARTSLKATTAQARAASANPFADENATAPVLTGPFRRGTLKAANGMLTEGQRPAAEHDVTALFDLHAFFPDAQATQPPQPSQVASSSATPREQLQRTLGTYCPGDSGRIAGMALAAVCDGDAPRALRALNVLRHGETSTTDEGARADAFAAACHLSTTGAGLDILRALSGTGGSGELSAREHAIQEQAEMTAHQAAERLLAAWPRGVSRPNSLRELAHVCNLLTNAGCGDHLEGDLRPDFERQSETHESASLLSNTDRPELVPELTGSPLAREGNAARALLAAVMLRENPGLDLHARHPDLALPYLAGRNRIYDQEAIDEIGDRLFKMLTYADRAAEGAVPNPARALLGKDKNPLHALQNGTGGQLMREPEADFADVAAAVQRVANALDGTLANGKGGPNVSDAHFNAALRSAILDQWVAQIGENGWQDRTPIPLTADSPVMARVMEVLHLDARQLSACCARQTMGWVNEGFVMTSARLRQWADDVRPPEGDPARAEMDAGLAHVDHMNNRGDIFPAHGATSDDYLMAVRRTLALSRMTYGVRASERREVGVNANVNILARPGVPVLAAGPALRLAGRFGAEVYAGSNALAGALEVTTQRGVTGWAGLSGVASWTPTKWFGGSVAGTLLPVVADYTSSEGAAIRTRFTPGDLESWRTTLLGAFDSMYGVTAAANPGAHATIQRPANAAALLDNLAATHATAPDLSIGRVAGSTVNVGMSLGATGAARFRDPRAKDTTRGGISGAITQTVTAFSRRRAKDQDGGLGTLVMNSNSNTNTSVSGGVSVAPPATGTTHGSAVFTPINLLSASAVMLPVSRGGTLRFSMDNGKVAPTTVYDHEFADYDDFVQYVDSRRDEWLQWTRAEADDQPGATSSAEARLDDYLARVRGGVDNGRLLLAERVVIQPAARARMDQLLAAFSYAEALPPAQRDERRAALRAELDAVAVAPDSWGPRFLYVNEVNGERTELGLNYWIDAVVTQEVSTSRQTSAYRARDTVHVPS